MIVLIGFMGAGKTSVGRLLAARLDVPFTDLDAAIESQQGRPVREIFAAGGEAAFRAAEHEALARLLAGPVQEEGEGGRVLAVGGGAVEHPGSRRLLGAARVVYLQVGYDEALTRVGSDPGRPMLARPDLAEVYRRRLPGYEAVATLTVPTSGRGAEAVCREVLAGLATQAWSNRCERVSGRPPCASG